MPGRGKRKAKAASPARPTKHCSITGLPSDPDDNEFADQDDFGRAESEEMLAITGTSKRFLKEDPFFEKVREEVRADELELQKLVDEKEKEFTNRNISFNSQLRALLTNSLSTSTHPAQPTVQVTKNRRVVTTETDPDTTTDPHPFFDHGTRLFAKGQSMLDMYKEVADAVADFKGSQEMKQACEKEKAECARIILVGEELARRQIEAVLQRPDVPLGHGSGQSTVGRTKKKQNLLDTPNKAEVEILFEEEELDEMSKVFPLLRKQRKTAELAEEDEYDEEDESKERSRPGFYPLLRNIERGAKRWVKHLPTDEHMLEG